MLLRTPIEDAPLPIRLTHRTPVMLMGSCFATHITERLLARGFDAQLSMGTLYNPASIAQAIRRMHDTALLTPMDLFVQNGQYHSYEFHSDFSDTDSDTALQKMNTSIATSHRLLSQSGVLFVTLGTAFVYTLNANGRIVANCHHSDAALFTRKLLSVDECVGYMEDIVAHCPEKSIVWTVSPIRHLSDGLHGNNISKGTLLLAIEQICRQYADRCHYFAAYEAVIDDLRDYRFYADDMTHPSSLAADYVYERLEATAMDRQTQAVAAQYLKLNKILNHRSKQPESEAHRQLVRQTKEALLALDKQYKS